MREIISRIRRYIRRLRKRKDKENEKDSENGVILGIFLALLLGFSTGSLIISGIGYFLSEFSANNGLSDTAVTANSTASASSGERKGLEVFLSSNPFKVSKKKHEAAAELAAKEPEKAVEADASVLDDVVLRGTLPGIGGWFDVKNELKLVLVGNEVESYKLNSVNYNEAVFKKNDSTVVKYIVWGPVSKTQSKKSDAPRPQPVRQERNQANAPAGGIVAAVPGSQEGQVPSELVSNMVQNPFEELKRIRIRPSDRGGLEVQWIQNDSLLKRLGVQRGDVIRSVNGIPFTNMGDIANSINSLMHSERFDVEVNRNGKDTALRYVVK